MQRHKLLTSIFLMGIMSGVACSDDTTEPPVDPPVVTGVSATLVSPGDTLIITGSKFSATEAENTVTFKNPVAATKPFQASTTELRVVVDRDATTGPVTVSTEGGSDETVEVEVTPRGVGEVFVFGGVGANNVLVLPNPTLTTQYLIVPHSTNASSSFTVDHAYTIVSASTPPVAMGDTQTRSPRSSRMEANEWFEAERWRRADEDLERYGTPRGEFDRKRSPTERVGLGTQQFYVLRTTNGNQSAASSYQRVTAELRYDGEKCLIYADIDTLPTGNFEQQHFNDWGQAFDTSIDSINVTYFGEHSDVDGNNRVIILVSPVVNRLEENCVNGQCQCGFIAGFFNPRDLYPASQVGSGTTNHAEIFYLLAADPTGVWDCEFPVTATASENLGTITHEHEHLISHSERIFNQGRTSQARWLEEGMAHMAEDLNGDNSSNITRGTRYRALPDSMSLEDNRTTLAQRGGIYLMLRLLVDRYGTGILKQIVQSKCTGRACIENVTGMAFYDVFAEFLAAQYLSGKGITTDERYNYVSINVDDFGPLEPAGPHVAGITDVPGLVRRTAGGYHIFSGVLGEESRFQFENPGGQAKLRSVIVRIQ